MAAIRKKNWHRDDILTPRKFDETAELLMESCPKCKAKISHSNCCIQDILKDWVNYKNEYFNRRH